jgi:hypothetical protein
MKRNSIALFIISLFLISYTPSLAVGKKAPNKPAEKGKSTKKNTSQAKKPVEKKEFKRGSKAERKEWEERKKNMKPLQLRDLIEENHKLRMQNKALIEGTDIKEVTNEYDIINEYNNTGMQSDSLGSLVTPGFIGGNKKAATVAAMRPGVRGTAATSGWNMAAGLPGTVGTVAAAGLSGSLIGSSAWARRAGQLGPRNKNAIGTAALAGGALGLGATSSSFETWGDMAVRDLSELPPGSYSVDRATGQVYIGGILDERYGVDPGTGKPFIKGILFKVQIGAKNDLDLHDVLVDEVNHQNLEQEGGQNLYKYTIGHFRNYWAADKLKKGLRVMGIELAWIVPYKDGKRVLLKEVLRTVLDQKKQLEGKKKSDAIRS